MTGPTSDAPDDIRRDFWLIVGLLNAALFGIALGLLLLVFDPSPVVGIGPLVIGLLAAGGAWIRYHRVRNG